MEITARINGAEVAKACGTVAEVITRRNAIVNEVIRLQNAVSSGEIKEAECPVKHYFCNGVYVREIFIPADTFIIGKIHKTEHFNEVISGECRVVTPASGDVKEYSSGDIFASEAGVQKAVYTITDVVWRTIHINETNTHDTDELESNIIAKSYEELPHDQLIENCKRVLL